MRGEFRRGDGLIIPNNVSYEGAKMLLLGALRNTVPTLSVALVTGAPDRALTCADIIEPTIGTNGYARQALTRDAIGWPTAGIVGLNYRVESRVMTWTATGIGFNRPIQRLALLNTSVFNAADPILALSVPLPDELTITTTTPLINRQFTYALYL